MALNKDSLKAKVETGFFSILIEQSSKATSEGAEQEDPRSIISNICNKMAEVVSNAVEEYVKGGDIYVDGSNIKVVSPHGDCVVSSLGPSKIQ